MSEQLICRSDDLMRLREEGYNIEVRSGYLLVKDIPYVNADKKIQFGMLVSELTTQGDVTTIPSTHVVLFAGEFPCDKDGEKIVKIAHHNNQQVLDRGLSIDHGFSSRPPDGYRDYYDKMTAYIAILSHPAMALDSAVTPKTFSAIKAGEEESVFRYMDTASSRAGIRLATRKLEVGKVAIVGLGGTGSYVLDLVAKTPVGEIHLFDGDTFASHNAFRAPGAPSLDELNAKHKKVDYFGALYSNMHRHVRAHGYFVDGSTVDELRGMDFVFLCLDKGEPKRVIIEKLKEWDTSFVDVGMGVELVNESLCGLLRVTASTTTKRDHIDSRISMAGGDGNDDYASNIQIADLNALNACLAVIKWKKLCGFYHDLGREHNTVYTVDSNALINEDKP